MTDVRPIRSELHSQFFAKFSSGTPQPTSTDALRVAEKELGIILPEAYKQFVGKYHLPCAGMGESVERMPEFTPISLAEMLEIARRGWLTILPMHITGKQENAKGNVFEYLVPFGADEGGSNYFCFPRCNAPSDDLPVFFFDHDFGGATQIAPSFDAMLLGYLKAAGEEPRVDTSGIIPPLGELHFTSENDHNPTYLETCARCGGFGRLFITHYERPRNPQDDQPCPDCASSGRIRKSYFTNDNPPVEATTDKDGWLKCPACNWRFSLKDKNAWTGYRHKKCGQRIVVGTFDLFPRSCQTGAVSAVAATLAAV